MADVGRPPKFKTEKEFTLYLHENAHFWVKDFFGEELQSIRSDSCVVRRRFGPNVPRIDFDVRTKSGKRIGIEVKNPTQEFHELARSVSQLLAYEVLAGESGSSFDELAIISSSKNDIAFRVIQRFSLPIRVFYVDREIHGEML